MNVKLKVIYDKSKPDGVSRKLLDISLAKKYGWVNKTSLKKGFQKTLEDFKTGYRTWKKKPLTVVKLSSQSRRFTHIDDTIKACLRHGS